MTGPSLLPTAAINNPTGNKTLTLRTVRTSKEHFSKQQKKNFDKKSRTFFVRVVHKISFIAINIVKIQNITRRNIETVKNFKSF